LVGTARCAVRAHEAGAITNEPHRRFIRSGGVAAGDKPAAYPYHIGICYNLNFITNMLPEKKSTAPAAISVSIVEDDDWLREDLAQKIRAAKGFRLAGAHRTAEAALAKLPGEAADVVLMDIALPGMSGIECVQRLKDRWPDANVLMLTVYEETDKIFAALRAGASGYLLKRSSPAELLEAIADLHQGGAPMSSSVARRVVKFFAQTARPQTETEGLSSREREILDLLVEGRANKEIADRLNVSVHTVRMFIRRIYKKMHVHSRGEAVARFLKK
jgi:DNA-binding NarL/FixJ family response regulator